MGKQNIMGKQSKREKYIGSSQSGMMEVEKENPQPLSTESKKVSPQSINVHSPAGSENSTGALLGSDLLALMVLTADFQAVKKQFPESWQATNDGKIYWCANVPGHFLDIDSEGDLLVDGEKINNLLAEIVEKSTGGKNEKKK